MNLPRLKGIIRERGKTYVECANAIGKSVATFNSRLVCYPISEDIQSISRTGFVVAERRVMAMLREFYMNGLKWSVRFTSPNNPVLVDRTNVFTVAVTDPATMTVYIADNLRGEFLNRVLIHELGHCAMVSFGLLADLHRMVKK